MEECLVSNNQTKEPVNSNGRKRQLPPWMLGLSDPLSKPEKPPKSKPTTTKSADNSETQEPLKVVRKKANKSNNKDDKDDKKVAQNRSKKNLKSNDIQRRRITQNKKNKGRNSNVEDDIEECVSSDDYDGEDVLDLTVDDLLAIAKEHVEAEKDNASVLQTGEENKEPIEEPQQKPKKTQSVFSSNQWKSLTRCVVSSEPSVGDTNTTVQSKNTNADEQSQQTNRGQYQSQSISQVCSFRNPEDVAEDMIDLLLGPSFGCSQPESKTSQPWSEHQNTALLSERTHSINSQSTNKSISQFFEETNSVCDSRKPNLKTEEPPLFKKKSSLRDKVMMLLD